MKNFAAGIGWHLQHHLGLRLPLTILLVVLVVMLGTAGSAHAEDGRMKNAWKEGALANSTPLVINMVGAPTEATVSLNSADVGRRIEWSTNGSDYYTATPDYTATGQIVVFFGVTVSHIRITGVAADTWSVR